MGLLTHALHNRKTGQHLEIKAACTRINDEHTIHIVYAFRRDTTSGQSHDATCANQPRIVQKTPKIALYNCLEVNERDHGLPR